MRIRRRRLRDALVAIGCVVADVDGVDPLASPGARLRFALALSLLVAGSALHLSSKGYLEQNRKLVTAGPYRFTRNPFYLANALVDLGLCALIGRVWVTLPYAVLWFLAYHDTIRREEERLASLFPDAFARYAAVVPRLLPTGRRLPVSEATGGFTLSNPALAQGGEYARILGFWIAAATIVAWAWIRANGLAVFAPTGTAGLGLAALVAVAWIWKLALAEVFRRPEVALLPDRGDLPRRRLVTFGLVASLYLSTRWQGDAPHTTVATIGFVGMVGAVALLPKANASPARRAVLHGVLALAIAVFAASRGVLWIASAPILWAGLAALDDVAVARAERVDRPGDRLWSAFLPIAVGAVASLGLVALARWMAYPIG